MTYFYRYFCIVIILLSMHCGSAKNITPDTIAEQEATPGPLMRPGINCLSCHRAQGNADNRQWTAAGTVYRYSDSNRFEGLANVDVIVKDAAGKEVRLTTNEAGNFYTAESLVLPFSVAIECQGQRMDMPIPAPAGSCNACHSLPPVGNAPGRIFAPKECH